MSSLTMLVTIIISVVLQFISRGYLNYTRFSFGHNCNFWLSCHVYGCVYNVSPDDCS